MIPETRGYDELTSTTYTLRSKEENVDYRFMPDPNLPPLQISSELIEKIRDNLPELPDERRTRIKEVYGLRSRDVEALIRMGEEGAISTEVEGFEELTQDLDPIAYFELIANGNEGNRSNQNSANWIINELMKIANSLELSFKNCVGRFRPEYLGELIDLVDDGRVTGQFQKSSSRGSLCSKAFLTSLIRLSFPFQQVQPPDLFSPN